MPVTVIDKGTGNRLDIAAMGSESLNGTLVLKGDRNTIRLSESILSTGFYFEVGSDCTISIDASAVLHDLFIYADHTAHVSIESDVSFSTRVRLLLHEPSSIKIGTSSLIANDVDLMTSDMHSVFDSKSGKRINQARNIEIDDGVWIGQRAMILKGAHVGAGSMIAAGSIVVSDIPENVVAAGSPARIVRTGIHWRRELM